MADKHIADAESEFMALNVPPDFCQVGSNTVPFDICRTLPPEKAAYAPKVYARGEKVLMLDSVITGVEGDAGKGVVSGVSQGSGDVKVIQGSSTVFAHGKPVARHDDLVAMNGSF